ncbi:RcnB family protein [Pseudosulfitobacter sp. SM2401]|uniref:RcnB family protein n=1 Tax=Pseudosulfitobacter sp. SM2401 TaxID=3350098 RepID=UPI0036F43BB1
MKNLIALTLMTAIAVPMALPAQAAPVHQDRHHKLYHQPVQVQSKRVVTPRRDYVVGERVKSQKFSNVNNWQERGWKKPGRGQKYVMIDGKAYLVAAATLAVLALVK